MNELLIIIPILLLVLIGIRNERKTWNNGVCKDNGEPWVCFDTDSSGARGYKAGDNYCWISFKQQE